jgi:hypothetical protein
MQTHKTINIATIHSQKINLYIGHINRATQIQQSTHYSNKQANNTAQQHNNTRDINSNHNTLLILLFIAHTHHLYAIGTEECEMSIQRSILSPPKPKWEEKLKSTLGPDYEFLISNTLGAMHLGVFIHKELLSLVSEVKTDVVSTGIGNVVGNKGGIGVSLKLGELMFFFLLLLFFLTLIHNSLGQTSFLFILGHLSAHPKNVEARNSDQSSLNGKSIVDYFDRVFWFGDLNYRINGNRRIVEDLVKQHLTEVCLFICMDVVIFSMMCNNISTGTGCQ